MEYVSDVDSLTITVGGGHGSLDVYRDDEEYDEPTITLTITPTKDEASDPERQDVSLGPIWMNIKIALAGADIGLSIEQAVELRDHLTYLIGLESA